jgi:hypothetical protein
MRGPRSRLDCGYAGHGSLHVCVLVQRLGLGLGGGDFGGGETECVAAYESPHGVEYKLECYRSGCDPQTQHDRRRGRKCVGEPLVAGPPESPW